ALRLGRTPSVDALGESQHDHIVVDHFADLRLEALSRYEIHPGPQHRLQLVLETPKTKQPKIAGQVHQQVDVAVEVFLAASHAAEHTHVRYPIPASGLDQPGPLLTHPAPQWARQPMQRRPGPT